MNDQFRFLGLDVSIRDRPHKIALTIIAAGLVMVPLIPFMGSSTSILAKWIELLFVALIILSNVILACFIRRIACRSTIEETQNEMISAGFTNSVDARYRFRLGDLMVLIAAVGVGVALIMSFLSDTRSLPSVDRVWGWSQLEWIYASVLMLMALTLGLALTWIGRLHRPVRLFSQSPGAIACLLASVVIVAVAYHLAVNYATERVAADMQNVFWRIGYWNAIIGDPPAAIGLLILAVWNLLVNSGNWRPEPTWIDRSCRVLGVCWICWAVINGIIMSSIKFFIFCIIYIND
jgi:hypothetical protein